MPLSLQFVSTSAGSCQTKKVYLEGGLVLVSWEPDSHARSLPPGQTLVLSPAVLSEESSFRCAALSFNCSLFYWFLKPSSSLGVGAGARRDLSPTLSIYC